MFFRFLSFATLLAVLIVINSSPLHAQTRVPNMDSAEVYKAFLSTWRSDDKAPMNVAESADALSKQDLEEFSSCAGGHHEWIMAAASASLATQLGTFRGIRLVDPHKWQAADPENLIAKGKSIDEAVKQGFSHALLTLSAVAFDSSGRFAALKYSFVCGQLCGNGGTVLFEHTVRGWVRSKKRCDLWLSYSGGPNISFEAFGYIAA